VQRLHVAASDSSASRGAANVLLDQAAFGLLERRAMNSCEVVRAEAGNRGLRPQSTSKSQCSPMTYAISRRHPHRPVASSMTTPWLSPRPGHH